MEIGRGAKTVLLLAALVVVLAGIKLAASVLVPLLLATFVAIVTAPLVLWLKNKRVPVGLAVLAGIVVDLAVLVGLGAIVGNSLSSFYLRIPAYEERLVSFFRSATEWLAAYGVRQEELLKIVDPGSVLDMVAVLFRSITGLGVGILLGVVILIFMLFEAAGLRDKLDRILGSDSDDVERMYATTKQVNKYLIVKTATSAFTALLVGIWCWLWGLDLPELWALLAFMLNFIPTIGSIIAGIPIVALSLIQLGPGPTLGLAIGYVVMNVAIGNFLEPRIFGRALGLSPLVVFLSIVLWGWLLGPVGALLSVPLTMVVKIFMANTNDLQWVAVLLAPARDAADAEELASRPSLVPPPMARPSDGDAVGDAGE